MGLQRITIEAYISERVDGQYSYFSKAAAEAKRNYQTLKVVEIILAAMVPFLSAMMTPATTNSMKIVVGICGVLITILSGALLLYKWNENWVNFRATAQALKSEKFLFLTRTGPYKGKGATAMFVEKIELILGEESQKWQSYIITNDDRIVDADESASAAFAAMGSNPPVTTNPPVTNDAPPAQEPVANDVPPSDPPAEEVPAEETPANEPPAEPAG